MERPPPLEPTAPGTVDRVDLDAALTELERSRSADVEARIDGALALEAAARATGDERSVSGPGSSSPTCCRAAGTRNALALDGSVDDARLRYREAETAYVAGAASVLDVEDVAE